MLNSGPPLPQNLKTSVYLVERKETQIVAASAGTEARLDNLHELSTASETIAKRSVSLC